MTPELALADILVGNDDEFAVLCNGDKDGGLLVARAFAASGQLVLYKMGEQGCRTIYGEREIQTGIFSVTLAKPFGAGDAFLGNVLARLSHDADIRGSCDTGQCCCCFCCGPARLCVCYARYPAAQ